MSKLELLEETTTALPGLLEQSPAALADWLKVRGWPTWYSGVIRRWIFAGRAESFEVMTDLPRKARQELAAAFRLLSSVVEVHQQARDGTHKLLLRLADDERIECVLIQEGDRRTACLSTQVGCGMGCVFCASGLNGVQRNLTSAEMTEELLRLRNLLPPSERLTHIVVMGMGEPLANLEALVETLETAGRPEGLGISGRHVTISTVGLPGKIRRLADLGKQYHLAVSLHAPADELRNRIVPTNSRTRLKEILSAADYFFQKTGRQVTFEYVLLGGVNDSPQMGRALARLLAGRQAHVNLIPFNEVDGLPYRRPSDHVLEDFAAPLRSAGISVKVRKRKGSEINAACGQLRRQASDKQ